MSHSLSGIITSFKEPLEDEALILVGNYCFIPVARRRGPAYQDPALFPYDDLTTGSRQRLRDLSFRGPCAYIETDFFGDGTQKAEVWKDGERTLGPLVSLHGYSESWLQELKEKYAEYEIAEWAINACLAKIGIFRSGEVDEFDTARLGWYRSNDEILNEIEANRQDGG